MKPSWTVLSERDPRDPTEPRVMFSHQAKGSPRVFFNLPAVTLMGVKSGARVEFLAPTPGGATLILGLRRCDGTDRGCRLRRAGATRSLCLVTSAVPHLDKSYRKITYKPRPGKEGEPEWVLEPVASEKLAP